MFKDEKVTMEAIKSPRIEEGDDLLKIILGLLRKHPLHEKDIFVIASKVVAVTQGRVVKIKNKKDFDRLVQEEADELIGGKHVTLTIKNNIFIAWAGIDRSNAKKGSAILWPKGSYKVAETLQKKLRKIFKLKKLGVIITDSCCIPLRRGVSGVALGYAGFKGIEDLRGRKDIYGNTLKVTQQAVADNLATAAHLVMGESNESKPFVVIHHPSVQFTNRKQSEKSLEIAKKECLFSPLYRP